MKKSTKAAAKPVADVFAAPFANGTQNLDALMKAFTGGAFSGGKGYEQAVEITKEQVAKANAAFLKGYEDVQGFGKGNVDAFVQASTLFAKGAEQISKQMMALTQNSMQSSAATAKALLGCKTLRDVIDLHADYTRSSFDTLVAEGTKLSELSMKVANESAAPIQARVTIAVEKLTKPLAA